MRVRRLAFGARPRAFRKLALISAVVAALPAAARAGDRFFVGPDGGSWSSAANWSLTDGGPGGASVPGEGDSATIHADTNSVAANLDVSVMGAGLTSLTLNGTNQGMVGLTQSANTLVVGGNLNLTSTNNDGRALYTLSNSGALTVNGNAFIGLYANATFNQTGGTATFNGAENVGDQADGTITQSGGSHTANNLTLGYNGAGGSYTLSGTGTLTVNQVESVGSSGTGTFTQFNGTHIANQLFVGGSAQSGINDSGFFYLDFGTLDVKVIENIGTGTGTGYFEQQGGTHTISNEQLIIGRLGDYELRGGSLVSTGSVSQLIVAGGIFRQTGANSSANIQGPLIVQNAGTFTLDNGSFTSGYQAYIGGYQDTTGGTLNQSGGTSSFGGNLNIAATPGSTGTVNLYGGTMSVNGSILNNGTMTQAAGSTLNLAGTFTGNGIIHTGGTTSLAAGTVFNGGTLSLESGTSGTSTGSIAFGAASNSSATLNVTGGSTSITGTLGIGNNGTLTGGSGAGHGTVSAGALYADTVILGSTAGGSGDLTISGTGALTVGGGLSTNDLTVNGGSVMVLNQNPPAGEDPELNRAIVGGYMHDGALNVNGGTVSSPMIKLGVSMGNTGTYTQTAGAVTVGVFGAGNDATMTSGSGIGTASVSGGTLYADTILLGSTAGGSGSLTVSGTGAVTVGGGLSTNDLTVNGGSVTVLDQNPPAGEDPVLNRAIVGGYMHDGALNVSGGTVTSPNIKLGVTSGKTGTYNQSGGVVTVGSLLANGPGASVINFSSGQLNVTNATLSNMTSALKIGDGMSASPALLNLTGGNFSCLLPVQVESNGQVTGAGTLTANVTNVGLLSPGNLNTPGEIDIAGNLDNSAGNIAIQLGGAGNYSRLHISGSFTAGGTIFIQDVNGFVPQIGQSFTIANFGQFVNSGYAFDFTDAPAAGPWDTSAFATTGTIGVTPEPGTVGLLALVAAAMLGRRRRR